MSTTFFFPGPVWRSLGDGVEEISSLPGPLVRYSSVAGCKRSDFRELIISWHRDKEHVFLLEDCKNDPPQKGSLYVTSREEKNYLVVLTCNGISQAFEMAKDLYGIDDEAWTIIGN